MLVNECVKRYVEIINEEQLKKFADDILPPDTEVISDSSLNINGIEYSVNDKNTQTAYLERSNPLLLDEGKKEENS